MICSLVMSLHFKKTLCLKNVFGYKLGIVEDGNSWDYSFWCTRLWCSRRLSRKTSGYIPSIHIYCLFYKDHISAFYISAPGWRWILAHSNTCNTLLAFYMDTCPSPSTVQQLSFIAFCLFSSNIVLSSGSEFSEDNFVVKVKMEIVVSKDQV